MPDIPPDYVNVPSVVVYSTEVPAAVKETYIQLRGLAWKNKYKETESYSVMELAEILGKSHDAVRQHMLVLKAHSWLSFRSVGYKRFIIEFPCLEKQLSLFTQNGVVVNNKDLNPNSNNSINNQRELGINATTQNRVNDDEKRKRDPNLDNEAVQLYRAIARITANSYQRELIVKTVTDIALWRETIEHWLFHGWNKTNVGQMLDSYKKGGKLACSLCRNGGNAEQTAKSVIPPKTQVASDAFAARRARNNGNGN